MRKTLYSSKYRVFCEKLVEARKVAGLTQQQLADKLDRPQSFVAKYEGGERRLDVVEFIEIARLLGANPREIITSIT